MPTFRTLLLTAALSSGGIAVPSAIAQPSDASAAGVEVAVDGGRVRGVATGDVVAFKGIPFAAPPVGANRWRAPQPLAPWSGVRSASDFGHDCMQMPLDLDIAPLGTEPAEDCLYVNVWRPAGAARRLPVMVWIYGGGFVNGGASALLYSGDRLAKDGIVVVSFNYRLGRFGTFGHPQLGQTEGGPRSGYPNFGFMDQIAALRWVQRNVAAFGGDPGDVTIAGESAGGMSVLTLLTSPAARGLFGKAVVQSADTGMMRRATPEVAEAAGVAFARAQGIAATDAQALDKLRALPAHVVAQGVDLVTLAVAGAIPLETLSNPVIDGDLAMDPLVALRAGAFPRIPVMIGATSADLDGPLLHMADGARETSRLVAQTGTPTWHYRYSYVADSARASNPKGAPHAGELAFFFRTVDIRYKSAATAADWQASRIASGYLVNFVKTGNPNGAGLPVWGARTGTHDAMLDFTQDGGAAMIAPDRAGKR
ncbi:carboxylesterase [Sphingomonas sp. TF3]|uniref:carboxylesterase/lipase family protein n=1 Tax=Sphingomonas sp. TF3 TaxID=2495580 RepID=UPI000F87606A|nr:carboxylesterase family protein [Sphingomonas sp. TF3]RUN78342.1 carboxylesterase [Sphingomonas sp. TF3]